MTAVGVSIGVDLSSGAAGAAEAGPISFVRAVDANGAALALGTVVAGDHLLRWNGHTAATIPATPDGHVPLFAAFSSAAPACRRVGWGRILLPGDTDAVVTGPSHGLIYRGARVKPGSVVVTSAVSAGTAAIVPAAAPGEGEWAFGSLWCREVQATLAMQGALPADTTQRQNRSGGALLNPAIYWDGEEGWPEAEVAIASSLWVAVSGILIPA